MVPSPRPPDRRSQSYTRGRADRLTSNPSHRRLQVVALLLPLARDHLLDQHHREKHQDTKNAQHEYSRKHQLRVERNVGGVDDIAQSFAGGHELAMGKNATNAAITTLGVSPKPNQMRKSGANATLG